MTFQQIYDKNLVAATEFYISIGRDIKDHWEDEQFNLWAESGDEFNRQTLFEKIEPLKTVSDLESGVATEDMI